MKISFPKRLHHRAFENANCQQQNYITSDVKVVTANQKTAP